jgi:hypothetical protein
VVARLDLSYALSPMVWSSINAKDLYFKALERFKARNGDVLPLIQLQYGKCEHWFVREFALALNAELSNGGASPLSMYADCERAFADISIWSGKPATAVPVAVYEVKALYHGYPELEGIVEKARRQLDNTRIEDAERRVALFFAIYRAERDRAKPEAVRGFCDDVRGTIRKFFRSDHDIRMTQLAPERETAFDGEVWTSQSWITYGFPREP